MSAALEAANAGFDVVLVEKQAAAWRFRRRHEERYPARRSLYRSAHGWSVRANPSCDFAPAHQGVLLHENRQDRRTAGHVRRHLAKRRRPLRSSRGRDRHGYGLEALRCLQAGLAGLRLARRHHQPGAGRNGGGRPDLPAFDRQAGGKRAVRAVRRIARQRTRPPPLLLVHLLHDTLKQTEYVREQNPDAQVLCDLQGHRHAWANTKSITRRCRSIR